MSISGLFFASAFSFFVFGLINLITNFNWLIVAIISVGSGIFLEMSSANNKKILEKKMEGMTPDELEAFKQEQKNIKEESLKSSEFGYVNEALVCPHCQSKGAVRTMKTTQVTKNRVNSVVGKAVGLGTNSSKDVTQMHCDNCETTWVI